LSLKEIIEEQKQRIDLLEQRELDYESEIQRREELILALRADLHELETENARLVREATTAVNRMTIPHSILLEEISRLNSSVESMSRHISLMQSEANRAVCALEDALPPASLTTLNGIEMLQEVDLSRPLPSSSPYEIHISPLVCESLCSLPPRRAIDPYIVISLGEVSSSTDPNPGCLAGSRVEWSGLHVPASYADLEKGVISVKLWDAYTPSSSILMCEGTLRLAELLAESGVNESKPFELEMVAVGEHQSCRLTGQIWHVGSGGKGVQEDKDAVLPAHSSPDAETEQHTNETLTSVDVDTYVKTIEGRILSSLEEVSISFYCIPSLHVLTESAAPP
jgi:hypothetical protein